MSYLGREGENLGRGGGGEAEREREKVVRKEKFKESVGLS